MVGSAPMTGGTKSGHISNNHHRNTHGQGSLNNLKVYHQNVQGLKGKLNLLANFLYSELIHIVCLTEHHLKDHEMNLALMEHYKLSAKFCRQQYRNGGTCIFVHESIEYDIIPTDHICKEKDLEMCAIKLILQKINIVIIVIYRSPSGNYGYFLRKLESFLKSLYTIRTEYIICGDINMDYLHSHNRKLQLDTLLASYNLVSIVKFPTRIANGSC
jgi:exonuclease III